MMIKLWLVFVVLGMTTILTLKTWTSDDRHLLFFGPQAIGTVRLDIYRTFEEKDLFFGWIKYREHSISLWRLGPQIHFLNMWFGGRIHFQLGHVISYNNTDMHEGQASCSTLLNTFAKSDDVQNLDRISVVYTKRLDIFGCAAGLGVPLGSRTNGKAPAVIVGMSNALPILDNPDWGLAAFAGGTLAHEVGHIVGFSHTAGDQEYVATYKDCGLDLRYPVFSRDPEDDPVQDGLRLVEYEYENWHGRSNLMHALSMSHFEEFWHIGIFEDGYSDVFDSIARCWYSQSVVEDMRESRFLRNRES